MIYLVSQQILPESTKYKRVSVEESLSLLEPLKVVGLDTETEGFDVYTKELLLVQLGNKDLQIVIDCTTIDILFYKPYLESDRLFLLWNAKFDLRFMFRKGIIVRNVYDGYLAEKLLYLGFPPGIHGLSLKDAGINYLGVELDKSVRGKIHYAGLCEDVIVYAAGDVEYIPDIRIHQLKKLEKQGLTRAIEYENRFVIVLAYIEYCGVKLDVSRWREKMKRDSSRVEESLKKLNDWVVENFPDDTRFCKFDRQGDLFSGFNDKPQCIINWQSSKQVIPLFEKLGFNLLTKDKNSGSLKKSVEARVIESQRSLSDITDIYLEYKAAQKLVSTYGENFINQINLVSGRIHTNFNQLMDTGRLSSGGTNKQTKQDYVNLQNLPSDKETRACFVAEEGNLIISIDYQGQESRIIADISGDKEMLDLFKNGCGDVHSLTAKISYPQIIGDCPVEEIKSRFKKYRQAAKGIEFAINYGGDANTIKANSGVLMEEANEIYNSYMRGFSGIKAYQDFCRKDVMEKGFILLNPKSGHKAYIYDFPQLMKIKNQFNQEFWESYRESKNKGEDSEIVRSVKYFFKRKSTSEKQSINYRIQATGALCFKLASIYFYEYLRGKNLLFTVKYCIPVHDEIVVEAPIEMASNIAKKLEECMIMAGRYFCKRVDMPVDVAIGGHWIH